MKGRFFRDQKRGDQRWTDHREFVSVHKRTEVGERNVTFHNVKGHTNTHTYTLVIFS